MASTSQPKISFLLVMLEEELTYGVTLSQNITYQNLLSSVKRKLNISREFDVRLSYNIRKKYVRIVDDDDVDFFRSRNMQASVCFEFFVCHKDSQTTKGNSFFDNAVRF